MISRTSWCAVNLMWSRFRRLFSWQTSKPNLHQPLGQYVFSTKFPPCKRVLAACVAAGRVTKPADYTGLYRRFCLSATQAEGFQTVQNWLAKSLKALPLSAISVWKLRGVGIWIAWLAGIKSEWKQVYSNHPETVMKYFVTNLNKHKQHQERVSLAYWYMKQRASAWYHQKLNTAMNKQKN